MGNKILVQLVLTIIQRQKMSFESFLNVVKVVEVLILISNEFQSFTPQIEMENCLFHVRPTSKLKSFNTMNLLILQNYLL